MITQLTTTAPVVSHPSNVDLLRVSDMNTHLFDLRYYLSLSCA